MEEAARQSVVGIFIFASRLTRNVAIIAKGSNHNHLASETKCWEGDCENRQLGKNYQKRAADIKIESADWPVFRDHSASIAKNQGESGGGHLCSEGSLCRLRVHGRRVCKARERGEGCDRDSGERASQRHRRLACAHTQRSQSDYRSSPGALRIQEA